MQETSSKEHRVGRFCRQCELKLSQGIPAEWGCVCWLGRRMKRWNEKWNLSQIPEISSIFRIFLALVLKISRQFIISWTFPWNSGKISSNFRRKIANFIEKREWKMKFHFHSGKILDGLLLKFWDLSGAKECKSCRSRKMLQKWLFGCYRSCPFSRERAI